MYEQNQQNSFDFSDKTSHNRGEAMEPQTAEYVFSEGCARRASERARHARSGKGVLKLGLLCVLCVALSFGAGFGGAFLAISLRQEDPVYAPPENSDLLHQNPDSIISVDPNPDKSIYGSAGEDAFAVSGVAQMVQNCVVEIDVTIEGTSIMGAPIKATASGSGVIISELGYIVTCNHVVEDATSIVVTLASGSQYEASIVGYDDRSDLAVIRIDPKEQLTAAEHGTSASLVVGEKVVAIGNPLGTLGGTVTDGIISATAREILATDGTAMTLLQTNAAINSGNSGGGLFNLKGQLIGIVNAKYAAEGIEGLAFAIPSDHALEIEKDLIQYGYVRGVPDAGLDTIDVTAENWRYYYQKLGIEDLGVYIVNSIHTPELQYKDHIVSINGIRINSSDQIEGIVSECQVGDTITVEVIRNGDTLTVSFALQEYIPENHK
jgi:serine protease Do